jgi:hypothetical protein
VEHVGACGLLTCRIKEYDREGRRSEIAGAGDSNDR